MDLGINNNSDATGRRAFTMIELILVIAILALLSGLLLPVIGRAKQRARTVQCMGNLRQLGFAMIAYAHDHDDQLPPLNSGGPWRHPVTPHNPTNWWYRILSNGQYTPDSDHETGVWVCPNATLERNTQTNRWAWGKNPLGYGPLENTNTTRGLRSIIYWAKKGDGSRDGSARLGQIKRQHQLWLIGDVGTPRDESLDLRNFPYGGWYKLDVASVAFPPNNRGIYDLATPKQPAVRHNLMANICFVDGHVETWNYRNLAFNTNDIWGIKSW
jgi:prepilin-type processing-associated H-X9-DG protein/prepilin-type N-terminal cleavage/methylation domain-containing protein